MSIALFGASTLVLQHKEHVTSLLGLAGSDLAFRLGFAGARSLSAAAVLLLQGFLLFKGPNPLSRQELQKSGLNLAKLALIWVAVSMAVYRCRQECEPGAFASIEQHIYRFQWYLRLFAASVIMYGTVLAALSGVKSSAAEDAPASASTNAAGTTQDGAHVGRRQGSAQGNATASPSTNASSSTQNGAYRERTQQASASAPAVAAGSPQSGGHGWRTQPMSTVKGQSLWPDAVCEAAGLQGRLQRIAGRHAAGVLRFVISPAVLVLLCAWWLPQHPMLRHAFLR